MFWSTPHVIPKIRVYKLTMGHNFEMRLFEIPYVILLFGHVHHGSKLQFQFEFLNLIGQD